MNYWLDLFTGTTWQEFKDAGATVSGFRASKRKTMQKIKPGDIFLCYLTGVMHWVGALEVLGASSDRRRIWKYDEFPVRFEVKPIVLLEPKHGVPMADLKGRVSFYASEKDRGKFRGLVRGSPNLIQNKPDGDLILAALLQAYEQPVVRPIDPRKLARNPLYKVETKPGVAAGGALVSIPEPEEIPAATERRETTESASDPSYRNPIRTAHARFRIGLRRLRRAE